MPDGQGDGQGLGGQVVVVVTNRSVMVVVVVVVESVRTGTVVGTVVQRQVRQPRAGTLPLLGFTTSPFALK